MNLLKNRSYFFDQGIFFECQRCGTCCTGDPGIIYLDSNSLKRIARHLGLSVSPFIEQYLYPYKDSYSISEDAEGRCLFYENGCTIYPVRPRQCSTFPFWFENLRSVKNWRRISKQCPGIGRGVLYTRKQILKIVRSDIDAVIKSHSVDKNNHRSNPTNQTGVFNGRN